MGNLWSSREMMRRHIEETMRELMDHRATDGSRIRTLRLGLSDDGRYGYAVELTTDPVTHDPDNPGEVGAVE